MVGEDYDYVCWFVANQAARLGAPKYPNAPVPPQNSRFPLPTNRSFHQSGFLPEAAHRKNQNAAAPLMRGSFQT
jgi:hypothetical protein